MGMLRRGNRDNLLRDQETYRRIIEKYDRELTKEKESDIMHHLLHSFLIIVFLLLIIGAGRSIYLSLKGLL